MAGVGGPDGDARIARRATTTSTPASAVASEAIDFIVFVAACGDDVVVVDTGFSREAGQRRGRVLELSGGRRRAGGRARPVAARAHGGAQPPALRPRRQRRRLPGRAGRAAAGRARVRDRAGDASPPAQPLLRGRRRRHGRPPAVRRHGHPGRRRPRRRARVRVAAHRRAHPGPAGRAHPHRARLDRAGLRRRPLLRQHRRTKPVPGAGRPRAGARRLRANRGAGELAGHVVPGHDPRLFDRLRTGTEPTQGHVIAALHTSPIGVAGGTS